MKLSIKLLLAFVVFTCCNNFSFAEEPPFLRLVIPNFPPFTYAQNGQAEGIGVEKVKKILAAANINYSIRVVKDYGLALLLMKTGKADGMFLASENSDRNEVAIFSKPIMLNRWCWYFKADSNLTPLKRRFKQMAKVGTILNTNTHKWLRINDYRVAGKPDNATALNKMLLAGRINAVFLAEQVFELAIPTEQYYLYHKMIAVEKPFGIYINKRYIKKNPLIMSRLNNVIPEVKKSLKSKMK